MKRGVAIALGSALGVGGLQIVQAFVNSALGRQIGSLQAGLLSASGTVVLLLTATAFWGGGGQSLRSDPIVWHYTGGTFGAVVLTVSLVAVRTLGAAGLTAAMTTGQLTLALVIDQFGLLGATRDPASLAKLLGVALLAAGVYLIVGT